MMRQFIATMQTMIKARMLMKFPARRSFPSNIVRATESEVALKIWSVR